MKKTLLLLSLLYINGHLYSQPAFQKIYLDGGDDSYTDIKMTPDSGFILCGITSANPGSGPYYPFLQKLNADGSHDWMRTYALTVSDGPTALEVTPAGGYIIACRGLLILTTANGDTLWTKSISEGGANAVNSIRSTDDGGYFMTGYASVANSYEFLAMKFDPAFNVQWAKTIGSIFDDTALEGIPVSDSGYIVGGNELSGGPLSIFVVKLDAAGDTVWTKHYGGSGNDGVTSLIETDGGYVLAGQTTSVDTATILLFKIDFNGNVLWTRSYGCGNTFSYATNLLQRDSSFYISGKMEDPFLLSDDAFLIKTDLNGDTLWTKTYGSAADERSNASVMVPGGGCILAGSSLGFQPQNLNLYLIKTDSLGDSGCNETGLEVFVDNPAITEYGYPTYFFSALPNAESFSLTIASIQPAELTLCATDVTDVFAIHEPGIYPNPADDYIIINLLNADSRISVYGSDGRLLLYESMPAGERRFDLSALTSGLYILTIEDPDAVLVRKIVVR